MRLKGGYVRTQEDFVGRIIGRAQRLEIPLPLWLGHSNSNHLDPELATSEHPQPFTAIRQWRCCDASSNDYGRDDQTGRVAAHRVAWHAVRPFNRAVPSQKVRRIYVLRCGH